MNNDPFGMVRRATHTAFQRVGKVANVEPDPDLRLYKSLQPQHFQELMKVYGEEPIINYIKDMESKMIMGGYNGK